MVYGTAVYTMCCCCCCFEWGLQASPLKKNVKKVMKMKMKMASFSQNANKCVPLLPKFNLRDIGLRSMPIKTSCIVDTVYCLVYLGDCENTGQVWNQLILHIPLDTTLKVDGE